MAKKKVQLTQEQSEVLSQLEVGETTSQEKIVTRVVANFGLYSVSALQILAKLVGLGFLTQSDWDKYTREK